MPKNKNAFSFQRASQLFSPQDPNRAQRIWLFFFFFSISSPLWRNASHWANASQFIGPSLQYAPHEKWKKSRVDWWSNPIALIRSLSCVCRAHAKAREPMRQHEPLCHWTLIDVFIFQDIYKCGGFCLGSVFLFKIIFDIII